jgi:hypothetical protein
VAPLATEPGVVDPEVSIMRLVLSIMLTVSAEFGPAVAPPVPLTVPKELTTCSVRWAFAGGGFERVVVGDNTDDD